MKIKVKPDNEQRRDIEQIRGEQEYDLYRFVDLNGDKSDALLVKEFKKNGEGGILSLIREQRVFDNYLYNDGEGKIITSEEYILWKRPKSGHLEPNKEEKTEYKDFKACWSLHHRGAQGETPLHLCFLNNKPDLHTKIAHALLKEYPAMALDKYEGEDYYGETSLHIAIVHGDLHSVKLLVKYYEADVHARATGEFFLPEDCKTNINIKSNYEGYAYYGEYPAAFAASFGNTDMYDVLVRHGADPNRQDTFGNTVLHMCVIYGKMDMYKHALRRKHKIRGDPCKTNYAGMTPLALAAKLGQKSMFHAMLELASQEFWSFGYMSCSAFPLEGLDSIDKNGKSNPNSALILTMAGKTHDHLDLLDTGIMFRLLEEKWNAFAKKRFYALLVFAVLYLVAFSLAIYLRPRNLQVKLIKTNLDKLRIAMEVITVVFAIIFLALEIKFVLINQGFTTQMRSMRDAPGKAMFFLSCILVVIACPLRYVDQHVLETHLMIIAAPMAWSYLLFFCRGFSAIGPFVGMIYKMCTGDMTRFVIIYLIFLGGCVQAFSYLMQNLDHYKHEGDTFLALLQMTFGEFDYFDLEKSKYATLAKLVFFYFNLFVTVLLLNMLIAMMASTYQNIADHSEKEWRRQWAEIIIVIEKSISPKELMHHQDEYSVNMAPENSSERARGIMVIRKTDKRTRVETRKAAIQNWRIMGKSSIKSDLTKQAFSGSTKT